MTTIEDFTQPVRSGPEDRRISYMELPWPENPDAPRKHGKVAVLVTADTPLGRIARRRQGDHHDHRPDRRP